jgi:arylsulfatase A-like enzyme
MKRKPNLILFGIDSLRANHMSLHGYPRLTTPHIDKFVAGGTVFNNQFSAHIPTTPGYSSMFTGLDCFGMDVVALRHEGGLRKDFPTLAEILGEAGYNTSCIGFSGNPASRGFQKYIDFEGWGSWQAGRSHKAENLNKVTIPELERLSDKNKPFFLFMRHMDPHSPYLPPLPFERLFYHGNETDRKNKSLNKAWTFKPFCDYFASWFPPGCTDSEYIVAQYDGELAYMDACIGNLLTQIQTMDLMEDTLIVFTSDHGETLDDHEHYFDHHGIYDCTLRVPLAFVWPGKVPAGKRIDDITLMKNTMPTIMDLMGIKPKKKLITDGASMRPLMQGKGFEGECEFYITECTWQRKHGWRTPQWKLIHALEPDFHFHPEIELYNLIADPGETRNLAKQEPQIVAMLEARMQAHIAKREKETGRTNPMYTNLNWHGKGTGPFKTSQEAYDSMHIGSPNAAKGLQAKELRTQRGAKKL